MRPTEVLRLEGGHFIDPDLQKQWVEYVTGLGVDPNRVRPELCIMQDDDGYHLHLSVKTPSPSNPKADWVDLATNMVACTPLVIDLGRERNWPEPTRQTLEWIDFSRALVHCRTGKKISRDGWNASGQFVVYQRGYPDGISINRNTAEATSIAEGTVCVFRPYLMLRAADGSFVPWAPTVSDVLARDWVAVD